MRRTLRTGAGKITCDGAEGPNSSTFVEDLLHSMLPAPQLSPYFTGKWEHRVPPQRGPAGSPPRTLILQLLNFRDHDELLRAAPAVMEISYQNNKLLLFPNYTIETQKQRSLFDAFKATMRAKGIKYSILLPAKLQVVDREAVCFFTNPRDAASWLESMPCELRKFHLLPDYLTADSIRLLVVTLGAVG